jgi:hypothetical protein
MERRKVAPTLAEAVLILMMATSEINCGNANTDGEATVERGESAVRRVVRFLAASAGLDLKAFASDYHFAERIQPFYQGKAA